MGSTTNPLPLPLPLPLLALLCACAAGPGAEPVAPPPQPTEPVHADAGPAAEPDGAASSQPRACVAEARLLACDGASDEAICDDRVVRVVGEGADPEAAALAACEAAIRARNQGEDPAPLVDGPCEIVSCGLAAHGGRPPPARVRLGVPRRLEGDDSFSRGVLRAAIAQRIGELTSCYRERLVEAPTLAERTVVLLTFDGAGAVRDIGFEGAEPDPLVRGCVTTVLRDLRLEEASGAGATFAVEISFRPSAPW